MKILFLTNNSVSAPLLNWLENLPESNQVIHWEEKLSLPDIMDILPDIVISYSYQHIIKSDVLSFLPGKFVNLHIALLPYNRGADPNAWSFLENTPKGVTIHLIDTGIDTGNILIQKEIFFDESVETLGHSYSILQSEIQALFREHWNDLRDQRIVATAQNGEGTFHYAREFKKIKDTLMGEEGWNVNILTLRERYARLAKT